MPERLKLAVPAERGCDRTANAETAKNFFGNFFVKFGDFLAVLGVAVLAGYRRDTTATTISDARLVHYR